MLKKQHAFISKKFEQKLKPFDEQYTKDCAEFYYHLDGKQYRLIYDHSGDYFCDIIYEGKYQNDTE